MQQLVRKEEGVLHQRFLPEQSNHGSEHFSLYGVVRVSQLLLFIVNPLYRLQKPCLLLVGQLHVRRYGVNLMRRGYIRHNERVYILDILF